MSVVVFISIELLVAAACFALAWSHVRRVEGAVSSDLRAVAAAVRRAPEGQRVLELSRSAPAWSFEASLATQLSCARTEEARVAAINEALAEVDISLTERARWPSSAVKIVLWGTMLISISAFLSRSVASSAPGTTTSAPILAIVVIGGASAIACLSAGRRADRAARDRREAADALVTALVGRPPDPRSAPDTTKKHRRPRRRSHGGSAAP